MEKRYHRFKLRTDRTLQNGEFPIIMVVTKQGKRQFVSLNISSAEEFWDGHQERLVIQKGLRDAKKREANERRVKENALLERYSQRAIDIVYDFEKGHTDWTLKQFKDRFLNRAARGTVKPFVEGHVQALTDTGHIGTARGYGKALHIWLLFDKKLHERQFSEIDPNYVTGFDNWLQKRGCSGNTRYGYLKSVKSIFSKAAREGLADMAKCPFSGNRFNLSELKEETVKRYLPTEYLQKLKDGKSEAPLREFARLVVLLSYYFYGMSFVDMANLKRENVVRLEKGDYIVYRRQKTKNRGKAKPISIRVTPEIESLMAGLHTIRKPLADYLLPIVTRLKETAEGHYKHIEKHRDRHNGHLKALAGELGLGFNLTSYVSRHTMAMQLQENEVPESVISQVLGHKKLETTKVYLDSLKTDVIDKAAEVL